jgi:hypothetical protein
MLKRIYLVLFYFVNQHVMVLCNCKHNKDFALQQKLRIATEFNIKP